MRYEQLAAGTPASEICRGTRLHRRLFLKTVPAATAALALCCRGQSMDDRKVMTVRGSIRSSEMGVTLPHEHLLANFQPYQEWQKHPLTYSPDEVVEVAGPYLDEVKKLGCRTFVDCTAVGLGRDARLLKRVSEQTGLHILTVTGNYAAFDARYLPSYVFTDSEENLAQRWIDEARNGIEATGIRPGLIKLGFNGGPLTRAEQKLIRAAAIAHLETGLTIGAHTGPAVAAFEQLAILDLAGVHPSAWIWIHAQNEKDPTQHLRAARRGAWVSFDGVGPDSVAAHVKMVTRMRDEGLLHRVLVSHDAGWYHVGEPRGGSFRPFDTVFTVFIPAVRAVGFTESDIDTLFVKNPANAFSVSVRRTRP
jgi:phosphotriesterase-related protein